MYLSSVKFHHTGLWSLGFHAGEADELVRFVVRANICGVCSWQGAAGAVFCVSCLICTKGTDTDGDGVVERMVKHAGVVLGASALPF